jgi:hypothetical protein
MQDTNYRFYAMFTTRFWGITTGVLCALLLQNCQSQLNALEEESSADAPLQSGCQPPASEALTQPFGYPPSLPPTTAMHQPKVPPKDFSETSPFTGICPAANTKPSRNSLVQDSCRPLTASTGELVRFQQVSSQWQAVLQGGTGAYAHKRMLPVVSAEDIGVFLARLQGQDVWASRSRIHIMATSHPSCAPCVYLGKRGLLGGMPAQQVPLAAASTNESASTAREQEVAPTSHAMAAALRPRTFGEAEWKQYFGDVGSAPPLPSDMATILDGPCPFWPHKKVRDTHLLVLIPATVGGVPFTLNLLGELIQHPSNGGHKTEYRYYNERVKAQIGAESPHHSYWLLMTHDVLPGSRSEMYADQKELVASYASREGVPYVLPSVLEAATAILMHHAREGERLFGNHPWTFTCCQEVVDGRDPAVVGGFESSGLPVYDFYYASYCHGVACCRKF